MFSKPQSQHQWFDDLIGEWEFTHECIMGPDSPPTKAAGKLTARSLGGLWVILEGCGDSSDSGAWSSIMTLGFDTIKNRYVGTFIGSMMSNLWVYDGTMSDCGKELRLEVEGPAFDGSGMAKYRDIVEIVDRDHWNLKSQILVDDKHWQQFMMGEHRRVN